MARASTTSRGYGSPHQRERRGWAERLAVQPEQCACARLDCPHHDEPRCPVVIADGDEWDLGHTDDRTAWTGPECIPCNRSAGARNGNVSRRVVVYGW